MCVYSCTLCHSTTCRLSLVSPRAMPLPPFTDKDCEDVNGPCKQSQFVVTRTLDFPRHGELFPC